MKINLIKTACALIVLIGATVAVSSCKKEEQPQTQYDATFYLGLRQENESYIYKDNQPLYKLEQDSWVYGVAAMPDGSIYACGSVASEPAIWKDGKRIELNIGSGGYSSLYSMTVRGNDWLCCGSIFDTEGMYSVILKNGELVYKSDTGIRFECMDCSDSGECYVVASKGQDISLLQIEPSSWKLVSSQIIVTESENNVWDTSIHAGSSDIAVGISETDTQKWESKARCWLNGTLIDIEERSSIRDLTFFAGYVVLGGSHELILQHSPEEIEFRNSAIQWVNGAPQDFSYGCTGNSELRLLRNWNNLFLFQCVDHDGGIQICNNGALLLSIPLTQDTDVTSWDIVVKVI